MSFSLDLFFELLLSLAVFLTGWGMLSLFDRWRRLDGWETGAIAFPAGCASVGALLYTLNVIGAPFDRPLVAAVIGLGAASGALALYRRQWRVQAVSRRLRAVLAELGAPGGIALALVVAILAAQFLRAIACVNWQPDTGLYHFPYAGVVYQTHHQPGWATLSSMEEFSFPPALFNLYAAFWTLPGQVEQLFPNLLPVPFLLSLGLLAALAARRLFGANLAVAALCLLLFVSQFQLSSIACAESTDLLPVALGLAAAYLIACDLRDQYGNGRTKDRPWGRIPVAALLLGLDGWTKAHGMIFTLCAAIALLSLGRKPGTLRAAVVLLIGSQLLLVPFFWHNLLAWRNPVYPGACRWLGGFLADRWAVDVVADWWQPGRPFYRFAILLWETLLDPPVLFGVPIAILFFRRKQRPGLLFSAIAAGYLLLFLGLMSNRTPSALRFAAPALALLSCTGGVALGELLGISGQEPSRADRRLLALLLAGWSLVSGILSAAAILSLPGRVADPWNQDLGVSLGLTGACLIPILGIGAAALSLAPERKRVIAACLVVAALGAVAWDRQRPFADLVAADRSGALTNIDWSVAPSHTPLERLMQKHMSAHAVTYTYYGQRWSIRGALLPADDPLFESIHRPGIAFESALEALRRMGATHVLARSRYGALVEYQAFQTDPILPHLDDTRYFALVGRDDTDRLYRIIYPDGKQALRPTPDYPMPWLLEYAAAGPMMDQRSGNRR